MENNVCEPNRKIIKCEESHRIHRTNESLNGNLFSRFSRNSFDRFGDDLCELLLSYLTFKDKIVLESVSKQWMRCIYSKQTVLRVFSVHPIDAIPHLNTHYLNDLLVPIVVKNFVSGYANHQNMRTINKSGLKSLLTKCKYIKKIELTRVYVDSELLELIGDYCPHLESIQLDLIGLEEEDIESFGQKYGKSLKHIKFNNSRSFNPRDYGMKFYNDFGKKLLFYCSNIKTFVCEDISIINNKDIEFLPKLENIDLRLKRNDSLSFADLVDKYELKLKKLKLISQELEIQNLKNTLQQISRIRNIEDLDISFNLMVNNPENSNTINDKIMEIAKNCLKLNRFVLNIHAFINGSEIIAENIFECLGKFVNLKYLLVSFKLAETHDTVECLKRLTQLTDLTIKCSKVGDPFFKDVELFLPNLKALQLTTEYDLSDVLLESLSKLKHLSKIALGSGNKALKNITDSGIFKLINSCNHLKRMTFFSRPNITTQTVDNLIVYANKNSKSYINFYSGFSRLGDEALFAPIDLAAYKNIPHNLKINIRAGNGNHNNPNFIPEFGPNVHVIELNLNALPNHQLPNPFLFNPIPFQDLQHILHQQQQQMQNILQNL